MELEHKLVDDRDAARTEAQQREDLEQRGDDLLPEPVIAAIEHATPERRAHLLGAVRMILDGEPVELTLLGFPARETHALSALEIAVRGRDELGRFVYAEDRRDLLERSLAALQPDIMHLAGTTALELYTQLTEVSDRVAELRHTLGNLEDAQEELVESEHKTALDAAATPKPPPVSDDAAATNAPAPNPSTLAGPDLPDPTPAPSTLTGPDLPEPSPTPSTLAGPDLPEPSPTPVPSSLEEPADVAQAQAGKPWWRRPFG